MTTQVLMIELNEINFEQVEAYGRHGELPELNGLIEAHGVTETTSETEYEDLEPWIQWVSAHTGKSLDQHGVFRLGDIVGTDIDQIWEQLESQGLKVGAISPMNAKNRCSNAAFFVPDPWTPTAVTGGTILRKMYGAIAQAVNDNAQDRLAKSSLAWLLTGLLRYARPSSYPVLAGLVRDAARGRSWAKALILDQLLADVFLSEVRRRQPDFASLFLNAGAHVQHHYMFSSAVYAGPHSNPDWYVAKDLDPVLDVYGLYDRIVGDVRRSFPEARLMLATGLHQDPYHAPTFYWRLKSHASFLRKLEIVFERVEPRMSRDFIIYCRTPEEAKDAERRLMQVTGQDREPLFEVDNRGTDLFVMLVWPHDIPVDFRYLVGNEQHGGLRDDVAFVAIKNGGHNGVGYFLDTGASRPATARMPLTDLPDRIAHALGVRIPSSVAQTGNAPPLT